MFCTYLCHVFRECHYLLSILWLIYFELSTCTCTIATWISWFLAKPLYVVILVPLYTSPAKLLFFYFYRPLRSSPSILSISFSFVNIFAYYSHETKKIQVLLLLDADFMESFPFLVRTSNAAYLFTLVTNLYLFISNCRYGYHCGSRHISSASH